MPRNSVRNLIDAWNIGTVVERVRINERRIIQVNKQSGRIGLILQVS